MVEPAAAVGGRDDLEDNINYPLPPTVVVQGPAKGRWRIGRKFGTEPVSIPVTELTEAQYDALCADPELFVTVVEAPH